jgi:hypothetical protein
MKKALLPATVLVAANHRRRDAFSALWAFQDFAAVRNVGDPQVSPDGKWILYWSARDDVGANKRTTVTKVQPADGGAARIFRTLTPRRPRRAGRPTASASRTAPMTGSGSPTPAGDPADHARVSGGASGPVLGADRHRIAFVTGVYPDCDSDACNMERARAGRHGGSKRTSRTTFSTVTGQSGHQRRGRTFHCLHLMERVFETSRRRQVRRTARIVGGSEALRVLA